MNTRGHFWCDKCDEPAFGERCQSCHTTARWVPDAPLRHDVTTDQARQVQHTHRFAPVAPERAHELFEQLFANLNPHK